MATEGFQLIIELLPAYDEAHFNQIRVGYYLFAYLLINNTGNKVKLGSCKIVPAFLFAF